MAHEAVKNKEVVKIRLTEDIPKRNICLVYDSRHPINVAAREFKNIILMDA